MRIHQTLYTSGRFLHDLHGNKIVLRGVNLPLLDSWNFPGSDALNAIEQTGANAVRIQWYVNYPNPDRPRFSLTDLDDFLQRCGKGGIVPILMLADLTCVSDPAQVNSQLIPWWTSSEVVAMLSKHVPYLIINVANEVGIYRWADDSDAALASYSAAYESAIGSIRETGLAIPIMIDAPDCGTSLDASSRSDNNSSAPTLIATCYSVVTPTGPLTMACRSSQNALARSCLLCLAKWPTSRTIK